MAASEDIRASVDVARFNSCCDLISRVFVIPRTEFSLCQLCCASQIIRSAITAPAIFKAFPEDLRTTPLAGYLSGVNTDSAR